MRIAFVTEVFLPKVDGITNRLCRTIEELVARGDEVIIFAPDTAVDSFNGCKVVRIKSIPFKPYPGVSIAIPSPKIVLELMRFSPHVVHVVGPACLGIWGMMASRLLRYPTIASYHTDFPKYMPHYKLSFFTTYIWRFLRLIHNRALINLCPSQHTKQELLSKGIKRVDIWRGGVDTKLFNPAKRSPEFRQQVLQASDSDLIALYVGRIAWEKNISDLQILLGRFPHLKLLMVGDGPARAHFESQLPKNRVHFTGYLRGEELATAFASSDFFVMPSLTETLGFVTLEAMSAGLPVLGANAGGTRDLICDNWNGLLYEPQDKESLARQCEQLIMDDRLRSTLRTNARTFAMQNSWSRETDQLRTAYMKQILKPHPLIVRSSITTAAARLSYRL